MIDQVARRRYTRAFGPLAPAGPTGPQRRWLVARRALSARFAVFGSLVLLLAALVALFAPAVSPYDPLKQDLARLLAPPPRTVLPPARTLADR